MHFFQQAVGGEQVWVRRVEHLVLRLVSLGFSLASAHAIRWFFAPLDWVDALQPAITGPDTSLAGGFVLIVVLVGTNYLVGRFDRMPRFHRLFTPAPAIIVRDGQYLQDVMKKEGVDEPEVEMAMREHGITDMKDVLLAVLEPDGTISIVPTGVAMTRTKHRIRYHHRAG